VGAGAALAALGGVLLAPITLLYPDMGVWVLVRGFAAMTLGGFGSLPGAVLGGLILGVMELVLGAYLSTAFIDISAYVIVIAVLLLRPTGCSAAKCRAGLIGRCPARPPFPS